VNLVLKKLSTISLHLDIKKYKFKTKSMKYLGFIIKVKNKIVVNPDKAKDVLLWLTLINIKEVYSFLRFMRFCR
ncbi:hypothetical protein K469DRAFT_601175, partial [Zopfia rhizophila CBS 207.26]